MPDLADFSRDLNAAVDRGVEEARRILYRAALARSSGTATAADRKRADFPYARRHGSPLWDPATINVGTGDFKEHWKASVVRTTQGISVLVVNDSKVADYLKNGTPTMFARPIEEAVERECEAEVQRAVEREIERVFSQTYS